MACTEQIAQDWSIPYNGLNRPRLVDAFAFGNAVASDAASGIKATRASALPNACTTLALVGDPETMTIEALRMRGRVYEHVRQKACKGTTFFSNLQIKREKRCKNLRFFRKTEKIWSKITQK